MVLSAAEKNDAAKRLFTKAGFRPTMVEMTRELNDDVECDGIAIPARV